MNKVEQVLTGDGCHSLYVPALDEHYHSTHGAYNEAMHVFIEQGFNATQGNIAILEIGFGTGLNAWLTAIYAHLGNREVNYTSLETFLLGEEITSQLNYAKFSEIPDASGWLKAVHQCNWETFEPINDSFKLKKQNLPVQQLDETNMFDIIYFDAFGPRKQPEMWGADVFKLMFDSLKVGGFLVTYCAQGQVKRNMKAAGFEVIPLPGPPGKREMTKAVKS